MPEKTSSRQQDSWFHTEVKWKIEIKEDSSAVHSLEVLIFNPHHLELDYELSIRFLGKSGLADFRTYVDDQPLPEGSGLNAASRRYALPLADIQNLIKNKNKERATIKISFVQQDSLAVIPGNTLLFILPMDIKLRSSVNTITVILPRITGWKKNLTLLYRFMKKDPLFLYLIEKVDLPPSVVPKEIDMTEGMVKYSLGDDSINLVFAFQGYPGKSISSWIISISLGIISGILTFLYWLMKLIAKLLVP